MLIVEHHGATIQVCCGLRLTKQSSILSAFYVTLLIHFLSFQQGHFSLVGCVADTILYTKRETFLKSVEIKKKAERIYMNSVLNFDFIMKQEVTIGMWSLYYKRYQNIFYKINPTFRSIFLLLDNGVKILRCPDFLWLIINCISKCMFLKSCFISG